MSKTYTLELTAEELEKLKVADGASGSLALKVCDLRIRAAADREQDDLRLLWKASHDHHERVWWVEPKLISGDSRDYSTAAMAKLMSAAPELLEAVKAVDEYHRNISATRWEPIRPLIERALRKVESGIPE